MAHLDRLASGQRDRRAGVDNLAGTLPIELHTELRRIGEDVVATAIGDIDEYVAEAGHVQRDVERLDERWNAVEGHALAPTVPAGRRDANQTRGGFQHDVRLRLDHRD